MSVTFDRLSIGFAHAHMLNLWLTCPSAVSSPPLPSLHVTVVCQLCLGKLLQSHLHMAVLCLQVHIVFNLKNMLMPLCEGKVCNCALLQCVRVMWQAS